jgi:hypothetical protein
MSAFRWQGWEAVCLRRGGYDERAIFATVSAAGCQRKVQISTLRELERARFRGARDPIGALHRCAGFARGKALDATCLPADEAKRNGEDSVRL